MERRRDQEGKVLFSDTLRPAVLIGPSTCVEQGANPHQFAVRKEKLPFRRVGLSFVFRPCLNFLRPRIPGLSEAFAG